LAVEGAIMAAGAPAYIAEAIKGNKEREEFSIIDIFFNPESAVGKRVHSIARALGIKK
jgi:hypothetical protein